MQTIRYVGVLLAGLTGMAGCTCPDYDDYPGVNFVLKGIQCEGVQVDGMMPPGKAPYVTWAPTIVPIGISSLEIRGGRFAGGNLSVQIKPTGGSSIPTTIVSTNLTATTPSLVVQPAWSTTSPGDATIVITNDNGSVESKIKLQKLAFTQNTNSGTTVSSGGASPAQWIALGSNYKTTPAIFKQTQTGIDTIDYNSGIFSASNFMSPISGPVFSAPVDFGKPLVVAGTVFLGLNNNGASPSDLNRARAATLNSYDQRGATTFTAPWGNMPNAVAAGPTKTDTVLVAVAASQTSSLYRCYYTPNQMANMDSYTACSKIASVKATNLWVQDFAGQGVADILALTTDNGQLTLLRDTTAAAPASDNFGDSTLASRLNNQSGWKTLAIGNIDGTPGADIIGATATELVVLVNDGGAFTEVKRIAVTDPAKLLLGDINADGKPDILVMNSQGAVSAILNENGGTDRDNFVGPVDLAVNVGPGGLFLLDGVDGAAMARQLLTYHPATGELHTWANTTK